MNQSLTADARDIDQAAGFRVLQRTILRPDQERDVLPLYASGMESTVGEDTTSDRENETRKLVEVPDFPIPAPPPFGRIDDKGQAIVDPDQRLTLCTYFNAFPASYWRRWSSIDTVTLKVTVKGAGTLLVYRSTAKGHVLKVATESFSTTKQTTFSFELPLKPFIDGGWYWYDIEAGEKGATLVEGTWGAETDRLVHGRVSLAITTFNRPDFCVDQLINLESAPTLMSIVDRIIVVDQGNQLVSEEPRFAEISEKLGNKLKLVTQANLGGSGGFSRGMKEAAYGEESDYVLLLDDDVVCEPEGVLRAVTFADMARKPILVGGHMLSLYDRSVLHAYGETIKPYTWFWGPAPATHHGHNFQRSSLRSTRWLHRRIDVDYNGWWMCMIPTDVVRQIGLSLPMFIKWDDAEYGLRAREAGYQTVTMPGIAVWHVPWTEKDDTIDWQAYYHQRNRLISALLHSPFERGGRLVLESYQNHTKRLVSMQYSTGKAIEWALEDILAGPERMHEDMVERFQQIRTMRKEYVDGQFSAELDEFPAIRREKPQRRPGPAAPRSALGRVKLGAKGVVRQALKPRRMSKDHPEALVPHVDLRWWRLAQFDSAIVSTADGVAASWYVRDPAEFSAQMKKTSALHARLYKEWPELSAAYKDALSRITSPDEWTKTFEGRGDA